MTFFFNDTATTEIYTLSLHDALPISRSAARGGGASVRLHQAVDEPGRVPDARLRERARRVQLDGARLQSPAGAQSGDRKSTRLNSSHANISYAVFCFKKKNNIQNLEK